MCALGRNKSFPFSVGLVAALAMALVCNAYLILLLWSGTSDTRETTTRPYSDSHPIRSNAVEIKVANDTITLNPSYLKLMLGSTKRLPRKPTHALLRAMNKLKLELAPKGKALPDLVDIAEHWVSHSSLIPSLAPQLGDLINYLKTAKIIRASVPRVGSQLKIMLTLEGGYKALLKPQWYNRSAVMEGVISGADRHNGEVAAFFLSLLLGAGMRRTPIAVGRMVNLTAEILPFADADLKATFHKNDRSETCFYGVCKYCQPELSACAGHGHGDVMEAAIILWLPDSVKLKSYRSPWRRTYKDNVQAPWETDDTFCAKLQNQSRTYRLPNRRLLDVIDASVFDFLIGNGDRHHFEVVDGFKDPAVLLLDNGKSFGRADADYLDILAPLYQCCVIRKSLFSRLEMVESGPLGSLVEELSTKDALFPLLTRDHLMALNRRLTTVLQTVELCAKLKSWDDVLIPF